MPMEKLQQILPQERIKARLIDVLSYASDAGFYSLTPKAVVQPKTEAEIIALFNFCHTNNVPMVFRTGGTSLSGQSITDGILVDLSQYWNAIKVEDNGALVRVQPGITGGIINSYLKKYGCKIGPDPASINAAMAGGILSNNSSGMCCGVSLNAYHTLKYIRFILPNGKSFNTENKADYARFENECQELFTVLIQIKEQLLANDQLTKKIREKYKIKNTVGYCINAFIDFWHPLDILAHLLIGAEGTLAFIAEAVLQTVPDYQFKSTSLLYFQDIYAACQAIVPLNNAGAKAVELMDRASLHAVENMPGLPATIKNLPANAAVLLVEFQESINDKLIQSVDSFVTGAPQLSLLHAPEFTSDQHQQEFYWKVRKGLFPSVGAVRASGSTVILEDVAFPVAVLGDAILSLQQLFTKHGYHNAIIFGHAKEGNIHFMITPDFNVKNEVVRYDNFMQDLVVLVVKKYGGALKAEHGTGRNMAPFVATEWGGEIYNMMRRIKQAIDPQNILNPGVIINEDNQVHIKNIKLLPAVEAEVDKCIECGYCEHVCPSKNITTTPRRRIVVRRELKKMVQKGDMANHKILLQQYQYDGIDTCAVDGLCAMACPVNINTGDLIKRLRSESHSAFNNKMALLAAKNFGVIVSTARFAIQAGSLINKIFGKHSMQHITTLTKKALPAIPLWTAQILPPPSLNILKLKNASAQENSIVYYPSCISRMLGGNADGKKNIMETFLSVSLKAGIDIIIPKNISGSCCSQIFSSKGYKDAHQFMANAFIDIVWPASKEGSLIVVIDVSSCAYAIKHLYNHLTDINKERYDKLSIIDCVDYLHDMVMPKQQNINKKLSVVVHPVCSVQKMGTQFKFIQLVHHYAQKVTVPKYAGCCGMAGDRGFLFPELTASATQPEATEVMVEQYDGYYSSTKTCEMALSQAVNKNYESILYLLDETIG